MLTFHFTNGFFLIGPDRSFIDPALNQGNVGTAQVNLPLRRHLGDTLFVSKKGVNDFAFRTLLGNENRAGITALAYARVGIEP